MSEKLLNRPEVRSALEQMRCERMPHFVRVNPTARTHLDAKSVQQAARDAIAIAAPTIADKKSLFSNVSNKLGSRSVEIAGQQGSTLSMEGDRALFAPLTEDANLKRIEVHGL